MTIMLSGDKIQASLAGAWRLMMGKPDGLQLLDLSAEGFWNSFQAIIVAAPALIVAWVAVANEIGVSQTVSVRFTMVLRLAVIDLGGWVLSLVLLALIAPHAGLANRLVHYVVASNWATAIIAWMFLPPALLRLFWPAATDVAALISLLLFIVSLVLVWRMTNVVIDRGRATGSVVFAGMFAASLAILLILQSLLGIAVVI